MSVTIIEAPPGYGKTYEATRRIRKELLKKNGRDVYSNYPVIFSHKKQIYSSYRWEPEYLNEGVVDSDVYIDEAWRYFSSRAWAKFSIADQEAFAECRHNGNNYILIAQHHARLDSIIRSICTEFQVVSMVHIGKWPLWFTVKSFLTEIDVDKFRESKNKELVLGTQRHFRNKAVERSYDTKYYRAEAGVTAPKTWEEILTIDRQEWANSIWDLPESILNCVAQCQIDNQS